MRLLKVLLAVFLTSFLGWPAPQSEESIGNLKFKLPKGWTKRPYRNEIELKPGDVRPSEWCTVTIKSQLHADSDFVLWVSKQANEFLRGREVLLNAPIPYQDDPKGWEGCGLSFSVRVNANTPTYYHMFIGFRRGDVVGTLHFVTDNSQYTQKYQEAIGVISSSLQPVNGFAGIAGAPVTPPPGNPAAAGQPTSGPPTLQPAGNSDLGGPPPAATAAYLPEELPSPAPKPSGTAKQQAEALAEKILAGGAEGLAALERAVLECGYSIHSLPSRQVIAAASEPNGMSFADIDLIGANALEAAHASVTLGEVQNCYRGLKALQNVDFLALWDASIYACRESKRPADRFYGELMCALGTQSRGRYSTFQGTHADSRIGGAQLFLLAWRSAGHTIAAIKHKDEGAVRAHGPREGAQTQQLDALRDLTQAVDKFGLVDWNTALQDLTREGKLDPSLYILAMSRLQILLAAVDVSGRLDNQGKPLEKEKQFEKSGESRNVIVFLKRTTAAQGAWNKFVSAMAACGYSMNEQAQEEIGAFIELDCKSKNLIRTTGHANDAGPYQGAQSYFVPIEGTPQARKLIGNVQPDMREVKAVAKVTIAPAGGQGKVIQAQKEVWGLYDPATWMKVSKEVPITVPVKDWKGDGWQGNIMVQVTGIGHFKDKTNSGRYSVDRSYFYTTSFDYSTPTTMVTHQPMGPGINSVLPKEDVSGLHTIKDELYLEGDIGGCGKLLGSRTTTWDTRNEATRVESLGLKRKPTIEVNSNTKTLAISFFNGAPFLPATKKVVEKTTKWTKVRSVESVKVSLHSNLEIVNLEDIIAGSAVVNIKPMSDGTYIGSKRGAYALSNYYQNFKGTAIIEFQWELTGGPGGGEPTLQHAAEAELAFLQMGEASSQILRNLVTVKPEVTTEDTSEIATCYATSVVTQGQLNHATGRSRPGRYRSSR